jgi:hypothetical protein
MEDRYSIYERSRIAITEVQLLHVDRIVRGRDTPDPEEFLRVLDERTPIRSFFRWRWDTWAKTTGRAEAIAAERDCFLGRLSKTLSSHWVQQADDWHVQLAAHLQRLHEELDRFCGTYEEQYRRNTEHWKRFGTVQVAPPQRVDLLLQRYPKLIDLLAARDVAPEDQGIQVHIPTRFTQGESPWEPGRNILQMHRHFNVVAEHYAAQGVRVMFGLSWQFDCAIGPRVGFQVVDSPDLPQNIMGAWYQIMNEDGTFNKKRLAHLLEHNELPYRLKCGFRRLDGRGPESLETTTGLHP